MDNIKQLKADELRWHCDAGQFAFATTAELEDLRDVIGQARAVEAMRFGIGIEHEGYNIFAVGAAGTDKRAFVHRFFEQHAQGEGIPSDWCYVNNFEQPYRPHAIALPAGQGLAFRRDMERLVDDLRTTLTAAFESEEYQTRRQVVLEEFQDRQAQAFEELRQKAQQKGIGLLRTPAGLVFAPVREGEVLDPEDILKLPEAEQQQLREEVEHLQDELQKILSQIPRWQRDLQQRIRELNNEIAGLAVGGLIQELNDKYAAFPNIIDHLKAVQKDVVENAREFLVPEEEEPSPLKALTGSAAQGGHGSPALPNRYQVNVLVDHSASTGAPVVYEDNPTYENLVGRVEHMARMGMLVTDFSLIKPGALHRANGGYLILDARKILLQPYAWEGLKRALQSRNIRIESLGQLLGMISTISLEPEPIPLDVKVALVGERMLYYMLWQLDPEFADLFKVTVEFDEQMRRDDESLQLYAQLIGSIARQEGLRPLDRSAVARVIEQSARMVGDAEKLSTQVRSIADLLCEANYWAGNAGNGVITANDVQRAIDAQIYRSDRLRERVHEGILRDIVLIDTQGEKVGQVNGLSVVQLGSFAFGHPARITAQVRLGKGDVLDIEREVELGGPIHSKGVLILTGFLGGRYAGERPLSLSASLVFEQSYGGVEGDSASAAELFALLSAIARVPLKQSLAVTGSVNQHGQVQAIGGVNQKIEGFFDICQARGLTGEQGVIIPTSNVQHLMLRQDVIAAVAAEQFHIYPIETIDQGITILTGMPAGERNAQGQYPEGSFNERVEKRLIELAARRSELAPSAKENES